MIAGRLLPRPRLILPHLNARHLARRLLLVYRQSASQARSSMAAMSTSQKIIWTILMLGLAGVLYMAFRGYLAPGFLIDFANTMLC